MFKPQDVLNWTYEDLRDFVTDPTSSVENDQYDFKATYKLDCDKLRKCFSAFANSKGGFIFFGIDLKGNICGVERSNEITTYLNRSLNNAHLHPPIRKWPLLKCIKTPRTKKCIYIYYVYPSLFIDKPHVADQIIYVREYGEAKPITSGIDLRRVFFQHKFCPENIDQLQYEIKKIKEYEYRSTEIDVIYFRYMGQHLEDLRQETIERRDRAGGIEDLLLQYNNIKSLIDEINTERSKKYSSLEVPPLSTSSDINKKYTQLSAVADGFIASFRKVHSL